MKIKNRKMILIDEQTFSDVINEFIENPNKYIAVVRIMSKDFDKDYALIKYIKNELKKEILDNVVAITDKDYLANDLDIEAVLYLENLRKFNMDSFIQAFNKFKTYFPFLKDFLEDMSSAFSYSLDYYNYKNPWFFSLNNLGILLINDFNYNKILNNYHKIKARTSDIILIALENKEEEDYRNKKLLKILCADSLITFGVTNKNSTKFFNNLDLILYTKGSNYYDNALNYVKTFIKKEKFIEMRDFLEVEEKSFEADLFNEEEIIKIPKKYELIIANKKSYSKKMYSIANFYKKERSEKEYFNLKKVY
ncbi:MAG: hypothetical protein Q4A58_01415 [Fusobacterium sp.]|uniref:hypothetical protein n=1 Tax=Fusobacterium sp. TaxID=68766 RepID=UPI0026DB6330|nr:hypothetical protein [Fusobacterium sp.]MDO4689942.1 hypothetical protein [Fusobacterium sp.]